MNQIQFPTAPLNPTGALPNSAGALPVPAPTQPGVFDPGGFLDLQNNPEALLSLLQFSGNVLQPVQPNDTSAGVFGRALAGAANDFGNRTQQNKSNQFKEDSLQATQDNAQATRDLTTQLDTTTNDNEQSLIDYRDALAKAAGVTAKAKGAAGTSAQFDQLNRNERVTAIMKLNPTFTKEQAIIQENLLQLTKGQSIPSVAANTVQANAAEGGAFGLEQATAAANSVRNQPGVSLTPPVTDANTKALTEASDEEILAAWNNPTSKAKAMETFGDAFELRALRLLGSK